MNISKLRGLRRTIAASAAAAVAMVAATLHPGVATMGPPSALASARGALDPATTAFVLSGGEGGEMPGCGAISAVDVATGAVVYRGSHLGSSSGLSAAEDLTVLAAGAGSPSRAIKILPARDEDPSRWTAFQLSSPRGPYRISGSATAILDGHLWFGAVGGIEEGVGVGRIRLPGLDGDEAARKDINPVDDFYSVRADWVADILPDPNGRTVYVLSHEYRLPANAGEAIESLALRLHILDRAMLTSRTAAVPLPPLVVDEPPGAGLRETGVHNWRQNGQIAFSTLLAPSRAARGWQPLWAVVNRWRAPELAFANLRTMSGDQARVVTATLPSDYSIVGALAASRGPRNLGMLAVHGGDKIGLFEVEDPYRGIVKERARLAITPVVSPIIDDRRMMSGPIAWSADGSRIIAAGNEGAAEVLVIDVVGCGEGLQLRHAVTVCPYADYNGLSGIVTTHGTALATSDGAADCPAPWWVGEPWGFDSGYLIALPWAGRSL